MPKETDGIRVASTSDLKEGAPLCVKAEDKALALFNIKGKFYATDNVCPHAGGPLCEGKIKDDTVICPWHGSTYRVATGQVVSGPSKVNVASYPVEVKGTEIYVNLGGSADPAVPKGATPKFKPDFNVDHPFQNEAFLNEVLEGLKFPFKLYSVLPFVLLAQSPDEIDIYLGEVHITEVDLWKISALMKTLNEKYKTDITYCLFHTPQFPGVMLLNIRGPKAPMDMSNQVRY